MSILQNYKDIHDKMLERIHYIAAIFSKVDDDMDWWHVKDYVDYDITFSFDPFGVIVQWNYMDSYDPDGDEEISYSLPTEIFEEATDEQLVDYCKECVKDALEKRTRDALRSAMYELVEHKDFFQFLQGKVLPDHYGEINEFLDEYFNSEG